MRMEAELDARVHGALAGLIQSASESSRILVAKALRAVAHAAAEVDLQVLATEIGNVPRTRGIVLDRLRNLRGVQILAATSYCCQSETGSIQHFLELLRRLVEVLRDIFLERLESVIPVSSGH